MARSKIKQDLKVNNKLIYDSMLDIHKHIFEQQKYAETKNNILLTLSLAILAVYARLFFVAKDSLLDNVYFLILFFIPLIPLIMALIFVLQSFEPSFDNRENESNKQSIQPNIYFFKDICQIKSDDLIRMIKNKVDCKNISNMEQIKDLTNQICVLSKITTQKYKHFNKAMSYIKYFIWTTIGICIICGVSYFIDIDTQIQNYLNYDKGI